MPRLSHDEFTALAFERNDARARRDYPKADELKKKMESGGYIVRDNPDGTWAYDVVPEHLFETTEAEASISVLTPVVTLEPMSGEHPQPKKKGSK